MQRTPWLRTATVLAAALAASTAVQAADGIFIKSESIKGLTDKPFAPADDSSRASSFQWAVGRSISATGSPRQVGKPMLSDMTWTQAYDSTYNAMSQRLLTRQVGTTGVFFGRSGQDGKFETQLQIDANPSAFTSLSVSSGGERPSVSAAQTFETVTVVYKPFDPKTGTLLSNKVDVNYNRATANLEGDFNRAVNARMGFSSGEASGLYLRLGSGDNRILGDSTHTGYEDWIKIDSFQMGLGMEVAPQAGKGGGFNFSKPSISEVTLSHAFDGAALPILAVVLGGTQGRQATLELVERGGNGKPVTTMQLELDDVLFSGISFSSGGGLPSVKESLNFTGYTQRIWDIDSTGTRSNEPSVFSYDMLTGKVRDPAPDPFNGDGFFGKGNLSGLNIAASEIQLPPAGAGGLAPVPEPSTYAMLLLGLGGLGAVARRRAQRQRVAPLA
jgi:type VI secretion system secreted protein Hcp